MHDKVKVYVTKTMQHCGEMMPSLSSTQTRINTHQHQEVLLHVGTQHKVNDQLAHVVEVGLHNHTIINVWVETGRLKQYLLTATEATMDHPRANFSSYSAF